MSAAVCARVQRWNERSTNAERYTSFVASEKDTSACSPNWPLLTFLDALACSVQYAPCLDSGCTDPSGSLAFACRPQTEFYTQSTHCAWESPALRPIRYVYIVATAPASFVARFPRHALLLRRLQCARFGASQFVTRRPACPSQFDWPTTHCCEMYTFRL